MSKSSNAQKIMPSAQKKSVPCPRCKTEVEDLLKIDVGMKLSLEKEGHKEQYSPQVCPKCYTELSSLVSQGARLRAQKTSRDYNKKVLWKNRVDFLKQARNLMSIRAYPEAGLIYEKYIKSVAIGFESKPTELNPDQFKEPRYRKELTVMIYVLWDLYKVYDSNEKYKDKQQFVADKLMLFALSNNNIQADIARKLDNYSRYANNKQLTIHLLKALDKNIVRCFIATAAFENRTAPEILILSQFRDTVLKKNQVGLFLIRAYYRVSPSIAQILDYNPVLKKPVRAILRKIALRLNDLFDLSSK